MRVGKNPSRLGRTDIRPARITACVLVHIPETVGYHAHRFDVIQLCLGSLVKHADLPYDLMVFDNGSCPRVVEYLRSLHANGTITYLFLAHRNIGLANASAMMFRAAPGELIAYCDDDVFFYPGWLSAQVKILDTFPNVGLVSGVPIREQFRYGNTYLAGYLKEHPDVSQRRGRFIPTQWETDFFRSTGRDENGGLVCTPTYDDIEDIILECQGVSAYSTATHFQCVARKQVVLETLECEWDSRLMAGVHIERDRRIDALGYARLSTVDRYVRHIGNVITQDFKESISSYNIGDGISSRSPPIPLLVRISQLRLFRGLLRRLSNWSYDLINYR